MLKTAAPVSANIDASPRLIDVEDDFIVIPSCRSSDIAVSERLRSAHLRVSAVAHETAPLRCNPGANRNWGENMAETCGAKNYADCF
jgi:hypothetical protein